MVVRVLVRRQVGRVVVVDRVVAHGGADGHDRRIRYAICSATVVDQVDVMGPPLRGWRMLFDTMARVGVPSSTKPEAMVWPGPTAPLDIMWGGPGSRKRG